MVLVTDGVETVPIVPWSHEFTRTTGRTGFVGAADHPVWESLATEE